MANKTISDLRELSTVSDNNVLVVETNNETFKVTKENLLKEVNAQLSEIEKKQMVSITDFIKEGKTHTEALEEALSTGKLVKIPYGEYIITSVLAKKIFMIGDGVETTVIRTNGENVFSDIEDGDIKGIKFESLTPDTHTLFNNENINFSVKLSDCMFENYRCVVNAPKNSNSFKVRKCYFRNGINGIIGNYSHDVTIEDNIFWQQQMDSINLSRGTGSSIRRNNFIATNGKPSITRLFSQQVTFEDNYYECYDKTGIVNECAIHVDYNNVSNMPTFRNNQIAGDNITGVGIKFVGSRNNSNSLNAYDNIIQGCNESIEFNIDNFENINIRNNTNTTDIVGKRYYSSVVSIIPSMESNTVLPIDDGIVIDNFKLSTGVNTIKSYMANKKYKLIVNGSMTTMEPNCGIIIKLRNTNGTILKQFKHSTIEIGDIPLTPMMIIDSNSTSNSFYRVDYVNISGQPMPINLNLYVELIEL